MYIVMGLTNTGGSYLVYLLLNIILSYQLAFMLSYIFGIILSFILNSKFVFNVELSFKKLVIYPLVYLFQYASSAFLLELLIQFFNVSEQIAPLLITAVMLPFTYFVTKIILTKSYSQ